MTRSPDSLVPPFRGNLIRRSGTTKPLTGRGEGEANLRAATVNAKLQHRHIHQRSRRLSWSFSRGQPVPWRRSLLRTGIQREWNRSAGTV
jgi:hypothetical protein